MEIIYSVNIGGYDKFNEPKVYDKNSRYILFTDNKYIKSKVWEICHVDFVNKSFDSRKKSRYIKINSHLVLPEHTVSIWVDHNLITQISNVKKMLSDISFNSHDIMQYPHRYRNCLYDESQKVIEMKKEKKELVDKQMLRYRNENFPKNYGLFETGIMIRKNNEKIKQFNQHWWNEINNESCRDQLSQMYVCWKHNFKIAKFNLGVSQYSNPFTISTLHEIELKF